MTRKDDLDRMVHVALMTAADNAAEVLQIVSTCDDVAAAHTALHERFGWSEMECGVVLNMQFRRMLRGERELVARHVAESGTS